MFRDKIQKKENVPYGWLTHWKWATMAAKICPVRVTRGDADASRDLGVHFFKARASSRAVIKL